MRACKPVAPAPGRVVGVRKPAPLGLAARTANAAPSTPAVPASTTLYYVVSKHAALPMQGYSATASKQGNCTLYGVFNNHAAAATYVKANKMGLFTSIVNL